MIKPARLRPGDTVANVDYGHSSPIGVLPLGCRARVDPIARTITVLEPAVIAAIE